MNGMIIIDKPRGKTSHDVVMAVKKVLGAQKVGHTGTLDPLATGVLPLCINEATKLAPFFLLDRKEYRATLQLGVMTDTYDVDGRVMAEKKIDLDPMDIEKIIGSLVGKREQIPPPYSAVKYQGKPLYAWARKGISIKAAPRAVEIYQSTLERMDIPWVTFRVSCSKGTYIRSLCAEIGDALGCGACLSGLRRLRCGNYGEDAALPFAELDEQEQKSALEDHLIPMADVLSDMTLIPVDQSMAEKLQQGYQPDVASLVSHHIAFLAAGDMVRFTEQGRLVAIAKLLYSPDQFSSLGGHEQAVRILRVFNAL